MKFQLKLTYLAILASLSSYAHTSVAAESSEAEAQENIEQIVVTGSFSGKAIRKDEASFAISSFTDEDIQKMSPKSTADLFKAVPGVWAESSGGVSGANVFVRGFPGGGDAPFLTVQLQGAPIFPLQHSRFLKTQPYFASMKP